MISWCAYSPSIYCILCVNTYSPPQVSLYDDLQRGKIQLENQDRSCHLIPIRMYKTLLQNLHKKIMQTNQIVETKENSYVATGFDVHNNMEYLSFCHSDITNLRFAMKDLSQDAHNAELCGLKQRMFYRHPFMLVKSTRDGLTKHRFTSSYWRDHAEARTRVCPNINRLACTEAEIEAYFGLENQEVMYVRVSECTRFTIQCWWAVSHGLFSEHLGSGDRSFLPMCYLLGYTIASAYNLILKSFVKNGQWDVRLIPADLSHHVLVT